MAGGQNKVEYKIVTTVSLTNSDEVLLEVPGLVEGKLYYTDEEHPYYIEED